MGLTTAQRDIINRASADFQSAGLGTVLGTILDQLGIVDNSIFEVFYTQTSATPATATYRAIYGKNISYATMTSGNLVGVRGEANIPAGGAISGSTFVYGVQGKLIMTSSSSCDVGSGHVCGVLGQMDISGGTMTSGHIACIIASIQDTTNTARTTVNGIYIELPTYGSGAKMNSAIQVNGGASYMLDMSGCNADFFAYIQGVGNLTPYVASAVATNTGASTGYLAVKIGSAAMKIPVFS